jgi:hypothetical protein
VAVLSLVTPAKPTIEAARAYGPGPTPGATGVPLLARSGSGAAGWAAIAADGRLLLPVLPVPRGPMFAGAWPAPLDAAPTSAAENPYR